MKRTGEKAIIIIATICNLLAIFITTIMFFGLKAVINDPNMVESMLNDPSLANEENITMEEFQEVLDVITPYANILGWVTIIAFVISLVLGLLAFMRLKNENTKNIKIAGIMLIVAGLISGVLSITSILYYIAAIMCFVRKPKVLNDSYVPSQNLD